MFYFNYKMNFDKCIFSNNRVTGSNSALFSQCDSLKLRQCLLYSNSGSIINNFTLSTYSTTITGSTIAGNTNSGIIKNITAVKVINSIITDTITTNISANYSLLKIDPANLAGSSLHCILNRDPMFVDSVSHDYHLKGYSPAIDASDPSYPIGEEFQHCVSLRDNIIVDMGYYGDSPEATCKKQSTAVMDITGNMRRNLYIGEIVFDSLLIKNSSTTDTVITYDTTAVTSDISGLSCLLVSPNYTLLTPGDSCRLFMRHEGKTAGNV